MNGAQSHIHGMELLIFDADGTLRRTTVPGQPCPRAPGEWELLPNVRDTFSSIDWTNRYLGVASNQDQVGYGLFTSDMAERLLRDVVEQATNGRVTSPCIRFCTHTLDVPCYCRKPEPGMLIDIMRSVGVARRRTLFVGDSDVDRAAARSAGTHFMWAPEFFSC
jgi:D-glycero-D-manno-heptose 1,7-bisphosphate phosphatase